MKKSYPIIMTQGSEQIVVYVPDFDINTQGADTADAMEMARDAIGLMGIDMQDDGEALPKPTEMTDIKPENVGDLVTLVDVDFDEYRRANDLRAVKKNCTIPSWLNVAAEKAGLNFSSLLAEAIREKLKLPERPEHAY